MANNRMICSKCGSENVKRDAWAEWNSETHRWELASVFDAAYCDDCDGETTLEEQEITGPDHTRFNCCTGELSPNWAQFTGFEIEGCFTESQEGEEDETSTSTTDDLAKVQFWTIYGRCKWGGAEAITDVSTRELANKIADGFSELTGLPVTLRGEQVK